MSRSILVVDDEEEVRKAIGGILRDAGYNIQESSSAEEAISKLKTFVPSLILLDVWLHKMDGLVFLCHLKKTHPDVPIIMISGHGTIETAVEAIKKGACDFIEKPFKTERLLLAIKNALEKAKLIHENTYFKEKIGDLPFIWGSTPAMEQIKKLIQKNHAKASRFLIGGHSGVGKERLAREIHAMNDPTLNKPFICVDCSHVDAQEFSVQLWGKEQETFGIEQRGLFEKAHGGTLFLKSLHALPLDFQNKIVKILHTNTFTRLGGETPYQSDFSIIASVVGNPLQLVQQGALREDLYYRLKGITIFLPPLQARRVDISLFVEQFLKVHSKRLGHHQRLRMSFKALSTLEGYNWPGNIRELCNVLERSLILSKNQQKKFDILENHFFPKEIRMQELPENEPLQEKNNIFTMPLKKARASFEKGYLIAQINRFGGNIQKTAHFIGMERSALHRKIRFLNIKNDARET